MFCDKDSILTVLEFPLFSKTVLALCCNNVNALYSKDHLNPKMCPWACKTISSLSETSNLAHHWRSIKKTNPSAIFHRNTFLSRQICLEILQSLAIWLPVWLPYSVQNLTDSLTETVVKDKQDFVLHELALDFREIGYIVRGLLFVVVFPKGR